MLSRTSEYALRAVVHLAEREDSARVRVDEMAGELGIPRNYLSKILHQLVRAGILESVRGPRGGFRLALPADRLPLLQVVEVFDPLHDRERCLLGRPRCSDVAPCSAHHAWVRARDPMMAFLRDTRVSDLTTSGSQEPGPSTGKSRGSSTDSSRTPGGAGPTRTLPPRRPA